MEQSQQVLFDMAKSLLMKLISIPSFSREEAGTATAIRNMLVARGTHVHASQNNVWVKNLHYTPGKPTILLNSHHDTVKPNSGYTKAPFSPVEEDGKLYGLGSNDAGGCLVSLLAAFLYFYDKPDLKYNLIFAASAEEEISGANGISSILNEIGNIDVAIVGEPTQMQMAVAEKGLIVLDCYTEGISGHAARDEGENALYKAIKDINWFSSFQFPRVSPLTGAVKMSVTMIEAGTQHNVVPSACKFTVDVRVNECYTNEEIVEAIEKQVSCKVVPRSLRLRATSISAEHELVKAGLALGKETFGSSTLSDKALMPFPALKMGPGDSARSHTADEFIYLDEIEEAIDIYIKLLKTVL